MKTLQATVRSLAERGDRPALLALSGPHEDTRSFSWLDDRLRRLATGLVDAGLGRGERVALFGGNRAEWILAALALLEAGAVVVPIDAQAGDELLRHFFRDSRARRVFTTRDRAERLERLDAALELVLLDAGEEDRRSWRHHLARQARSLPEVAPDDLAALFYTAGTTGRPKGVPLTHDNCASNLRALLDAGLVEHGDRVLLPLPLHHVYPFMVGMMAPLASGATLVLPAALTGPELVRALHVGQVTAIVGVPRFYEALVAGLHGRLARLGRPLAPLVGAALEVSGWLRRRLGVAPGRVLFAPLRARFAPRLKLLASGGARLDPALAWKLEGLGWTVATGYGLTETSPILTFNVPGQQRLDTAGRPLAGVELRIDRPNERGEGEVQARGPGVFGGYENLPDETARVFTPDGWFRTGDLGRLDAGGYLHLVGRVSELIVLPGGENVMPEDVERGYQTEDVVREIGVLEREGRLVAVVVPEPAEVRRRAGDADAAVREAIAGASRRLPSYQRVSDYGLTRQPLPRTRLGKLRRHRLLEIWEQTRRGDEAEARVARPAAIEELSVEDRSLLEHPAARQVWDGLARRYPDRGLTPESSPQLDLGVDSLEWLNLTLELRGRAGVELTEAVIARVETVRDLLREVVAAAATGGAPERVDPVEHPDAVLSDAQQRWLAPRGPLLFALGLGVLGLARLIGRTLFRLEVHGVDALPSGPLVITPNHRSYLDPFVLAAVLPLGRLRQTYWGGITTTLFTNPLTRLFSRATQVVPVDAERAAISSLAFAAAVLRRGHTLVWFPEGGRSPSGELQSFRPGIGLLLERLPRPVVPVFIHGTERALPPGRVLPRLTRVSVVFGRPLDPGQLGREGDGSELRDRITTALRDEVATLGIRSRAEAAARPPSRVPRLQHPGVMTYAGALIGAFALGVASSYLLDPAHGRRRRALTRDKIDRGAHMLRDAAETTSRDIANRSRGVRAGLRSRLAREHVSDEVLVERVRARLGDAVSHPHAIRVTADGGCVTLAGQILAREMDATVRRVAGTRGVQLVDNQLEARASAQGAPDLQGDSAPRRDRRRFELAQEQWSPTARLLTGAAAVALGAWGIRRAGAVRAVAGGAGATLFGRAVTNLELKRLFGVGAGRHAVVVQKTIHVAAAPEEVYNLWSRYEEFPSFMANVRQVRRGPSGRAHWRIAGPLGLPIEFDTTETRRVRNELVSWKTFEGSLVAHAGTVRFDPDARGTRIHLQMVYNPPAGAVGHGLAMLLGADPRRLMHGDLVRLKSLLEDGKTRAHGQSIEREALG